TLRVRFPRSLRSLGAAEHGVRLAAIAERKGTVMPYANNQGVRIHYRVEGEGLPLVLQHGYTQSLEHWYQCGYVDALKAHYRLVLVDARGHGGSDKPHERA